jgi:hypothetical protein
VPSDGENKKYSAKLEILIPCCENSSLLEFYAVQVGNIAVIFRVEKPKKTGQSLSLGLCMLFAYRDAVDF